MPEMDGFTATRILRTDPRFTPGTWAGKVSAMSMRPASIAEYGSRVAIVSR
jgi:hypothetical protein